MEILLVNGRRVATAQHPSTPRVIALASALVDLGHRVRWLCLLGGDEPAPAAQDGVIRRDVRRADQPFRKVSGRLFDPETDRALSEELRDELPDVVHLFTLAGCTSPTLGWVCDRLGVPFVVDLDVADALCHRGSRVNEVGRDCESWEDAERCVRCCSKTSVDRAAGQAAARAAGATRIDADELSPTQSMLATVCSPLRGLSPFPSRVEFLNRLDLIVASAVLAQSLIVDDPEAAAHMVAAGVPERLLQVAQPAAGRAGLAASDWVRYYAQAADDGSTS